MTVAPLPVGPEGRHWRSGPGGVRKLSSVPDTDDHHVERLLAQRAHMIRQHVAQAAEIRRLADLAAAHLQRAQDAEAKAAGLRDAMAALLPARPTAPGWLRNAVICDACGCLLKPTDTCPSCLAAVLEGPA